ncbi:MAG TPA: hypothetical protein VFS83_14230, partial [Ktedonobacterales bacterium]|nr:hypothetical protein [Ktedonobacterales bacterium]
ANRDGILFPANMHCPKPSVVTMHKRIDKRFTKRARIVVWNRNAKKADLYLLLFYSRSELIHDTLKRLQQWRTVEIVDTDFCTAENLERHLMGWEMLSQRRFTAKEEQTGDSWDATAILASNESERTLYFLITQTDERSVATIPLDKLAEPFTL